MKKSNKPEVTPKELLKEFDQIISLINNISNQDLTQLNLDELSDRAKKIQKEMNSYNIQTNEIGPNFFLLDFKSCKLTASFVERNLEKSGIILREMNSYGIKNCLRLTIGNVRENILLINQMKKIFKNV